MSASTDSSNRLPIENGSDVWSDEMTFATRMFGVPVGLEAMIEISEPDDPAVTKRGFSGRQIIKGKADFRGAKVYGQYDTATKQGWIVMEGIDD